MGDALEEPGKCDEHQESDDCDEADLERMRACYRFELHQLTDRVLPSCSPAQEHDGDDRAYDRDGNLQGEQDAFARFRKLHIGPQPPPSDADAVATGETRS